MGPFRLEHLEPLLVGVANSFLYVHLTWHDSDQGSLALILRFQALSALTTSESSARG